MPDKFKDLAVSARVADLIFDLFRPPRVRILIVADTSVTFTSNFGIGMVVDELRAASLGYARLQVDLARWGADNDVIAENVNPNAALRQERYTGFRFDSQVSGQQVIDGYDEIWCFGFAPGNDAGPDGNIAVSGYAATEAELSVLTAWMNAGGGMLAMGDHHYLGAAMCAGIPRVRSMRRWTNADGVPPIGGPARVDTNRPMNAQQDASKTVNPMVIPIDAQEDTIVQPIEVRHYPAGGWMFGSSSRPHPVLCGGQLGVIDVLPDHPHEGIVREDAEINLTATYSFNGGVTAGDEYPSVGGTRQSPEVIAWGHTLPDPPYNHAKQDSPAKRFGIIGVYDGDAAGVGRVAVDATWHHWMDMNIGALRTADTPEWHKIRQYFLNTAVWLARRGQRSRMLTQATFWTTLTAAGIEEFHPRHGIFWLGGSAYDVIGRRASDCLIVDWFIDIRDLLEKYRKVEIPHLPFPGPGCLTCPPEPLHYHAALGALVEAVLPYRDQVLAGELDDLERLEAIADELPGRAVRSASRELAELFATTARAYDQYAALAADFRGAEQSTLS